MASSNKTTNLQLNQWVLSDKPRMDDFNSDNLKIDQNVGPHLKNSTIHITSEERSKWNGAPQIKVGTYVGDNTTSRTINVGFTPKFCVVFAQDKMPVDPANDASVWELYTATACTGAGSKGLTITTNGFTVTHQQTTPIDRRYVRLNFTGLTYGYFAIG